MKFSLGVAAALAGFAAAQQPADVFMLRSQKDDSSDLPTLGRSVAHLALLQRLAPEAGVGSIDDFPKDTVEATVSYINKFGRAPQPLFGDASSSSEPSQLLIMLEGATPDNTKGLRKSLGGDDKAAFQVAEAPSALANHNFVEQDLPSVGVAQTSCELERAINPVNDECWTGKSSVALYDIQKEPSVASSLADNMNRLAQLAKSGDMETTIVLLPESSRSSDANSWSPSPLRRRQRAEAVMSEASAEAETDEIEVDIVDDTDTDAIPDDSTEQSPNNKEGPFVVSSNQNTIPACFASKDSCLTVTGNCSGHGDCVDKYAKGGDASSSDDSGCFVCRCLSTTGDSGSVTHWGGSTCSKVDVSVPFWLFAGVTLMLIGVLTFAVGLLFGIGEEALPGVIGAGVSKSK